MVSRLKPLNVSLDFQEGPYKLGETIRLKVILEPTRDVELREGRIDLVCQETYTESYTVTGPTLYASSGRAAPRAQVPRKVTKQHKETYTHSSVVFLQETMLDAESATAYDVRLEIQPESPPHADNATAKWTLVANVDVARARDVKSRRAVKVLSHQ